MVVKINLKEIRNRAGLSQYALAQATGMTLGSIQKMEYNRAKSIPLDTMNRLCNALKCQPADLFIYTPDESNDN